MKLGPRFKAVPQTKCAFGLLWVILCEPRRPAGRRPKKNQKTTKKNKAERRRKQKDGKGKTKRKEKEKKKTEKKRKRKEKKQKKHLPILQSTLEAPLLSTGGLKGNLSRVALRRGLKGDLVEEEVGAYQSNMSETQHHHPHQEQADFIQGGTRSAKVYLDELLDASDSTNRDHAKAHALWPLLRCVAIAVASCWCVCVGGVASGCWMLAACLSACVLACGSHVYVFAQTHSHLHSTVALVTASTKPLSRPLSHPETNERFQKTTHAPLRATRDQPRKATFAPLRATERHFEPIRKATKSH